MFMSRTGCKVDSKVLGVLARNFNEVEENVPL